MICRHQAYRADYKTSAGDKLVYCRRRKLPCVSQRMCAEKGKYILSEYADKFCKEFERV